VAPQVEALQKLGRYKRYRLLVRATGAPQHCRATSIHTLSLIVPYPRERSIRCRSATICGADRLVEKGHRATNVLKGSWTLQSMSWESNYKRGEMKGIEVLRKSSKSAVK